MGMQATHRLAAILMLLVAAAEDVAVEGLFQRLMQQQARMISGVTHTVRNKAEARVQAAILAAYMSTG
jgi:hypothetical protein